MKITKLTSHPARPGKLRIYIDDKYAFELSRKAVNALHLNEGDDLEDTRLRTIRLVAARESAIGLLARRERSRAELMTALKRKGFDSGIIDNVLSGIEKEGLQSDARFASAWVETRRRLSPRGKAALAYELKQKGIRESDAAGALSRFQTDDERQALRDLISNRLERFIIGKEEKEKFKRRLLGFLSRRGFAYEDIRAVLSHDFPQWA